MNAASPNEVLHALEGARVARGLSKAELARRSRLRSQTVRRLLTDTSPNPTLDVLLRLLRAVNLGLGFVELPAGSVGVDRDELHGWLAFYGAPLYGAAALDGRRAPKAEVVLAEGLSASRRDATLARALPVAFWKNRKSLDFVALREEAERRNQTQALGFFLDLTAELSGDARLRRLAARLRAQPPGRAVQFFRPTSARERQLAELRTPEAAKRWGFRMNLPLDSFASMFEKGRK